MFRDEAPEGPDADWRSELYLSLLTLSFCCCRSACDNVVYNIIWPQTLRCRRDRCDVVFTGLYAGETRLSGR